MDLRWIYPWLSGETLKELEELWGINERYSDSIRSNLWKETSDSSSGRIYKAVVNIKILYEHHLSMWWVWSSLFESIVSNVMWSWDNKNHQQYSQSVVVKSGTINLFPGQGTAPGFRQLKTVIELRFENMPARFYNPIYTQL